MIAITDRENESQSVVGSPQRETLSALSLVAYRFLEKAVGMGVSANGTRG